MCNLFRHNKIFDKKRATEEVVHYLCGMRRFYRFLFKLPQRKWIGIGSLFIDLKGYSTVFFRSLFLKNRLGNEEERIWICVPVFNRWEMFFEHLLPSLLALKERHRVALSIFDTGSDRYEEWMEKLNNLWDGSLVLERQEAEFTRAWALNRAVRQCYGSYLFLCDTDMSLPPDFVKRYFTFVTASTTWFPICQWQTGKESSAWRWFTEGCGMAGLARKQFNKAKGLNENYKEWGKEDWDLYFEMYENKYAAIRTREYGLYHHWHISKKPSDFKAMF